MMAAMTPSHLPRRLFLTLAAVSMSASLAACSDDEALPARLERIKPTDIPTPPITPRPEPPLESRLVRGPQFTLSIPAAWTDATIRGPQGQTGYAYDADGRPPERPVRVAVVIDDPAESDSIEQAQVLVVAKKALGVEEVRSSLLTWPGAERAVLVDWVETASGSEVAFRTRQLMVQSGPRVIVNVLAVAPADEFEDLELDDIVATLTIL